MNELRTIHPFPARMAPEIALDRIRSMREGDVLLDPMCGSGTVLRAGVEHGVHAIGRDIDPLAVLIASVWASPPPVARFLNEVDGVSQLARTYSKRFPNLSLAPDAETEEFIRFWFAEPQLSDLGALARAIREGHWATREALWVAFSKLIITKDSGASLARDVSHSRPHRVAESVRFDVFRNFALASRRLAHRFDSETVRGTADVRWGDSRSLESVANQQVDCIISSPPYLNAIDYMRGHRMALVWMDFSIETLRGLRADSIGSERVLKDPEWSTRARGFVSGTNDEDPPARVLGWATRYLADAQRVVEESKRVLRPGGELTFVVGNSRLRGWTVDNAGIYTHCLDSAGFRFLGSVERDIPMRNRYLPSTGGLAGRMRSETVVSARAPGLTSAPRAQQNATL